MTMIRRIGPLMALSLPLVLSGVLAPPAAAQDCPGDGTQLALNECAGKALAAADAALDKRVAAIHARLKDQPERAEKLEAAQKAWTAYREAECGFAASGVEGGSIYPLIAAQCQAELARTRTEALDRYLHCEEGDTTCPVPPA